jgi:hypothetical protein
LQILVWTLLRGFCTLANYHHFRCIGKLKMRPKSAEPKLFSSHTNRKNGQIGGKFAGGSSLAALAAGLVLGGGVLTAPAAFGLTGGIMANGSGGALTVTAPDLLTETNGDGINATNNSPGTDLTITATDVLGGQDGIDVRNNGTGALSVTSTGSVTGTNLGIRANNSGTDLTVAAASVSGSTGINARNDGTGSLSVTASGTVTGTSFRGVVARNQNLGLDLDINVVNVTGDVDGIYAQNLGRGAMSVTSTGTVAGTSTYGILARNFGTDLKISVNDVSGGTKNGIMAVNYGTGAMSVKSTGAVSSLSDAGINARNEVNGTDFEIVVSSVTGGSDGILATNNGAGALSVTATGAVTGTAGGNGVSATNFGTDLSISTASVSGDSKGIYARN